MQHAACLRLYVVACGPPAEPDLMTWEAAALTVRACSHADPRSLYLTEDEPCRINIDFSFAICVQEGKVEAAQGLLASMQSAPHVSARSGWLVLLNGLLQKGLYQKVGG